MTIGMQILEFQGCIAFIDGIFFKNLKTLDNVAHGLWFNGWKKMHFMNNIVVMDHHGLFIYLDVGYQDSFHDVTNVGRVSQIMPNNKVWTP